MHWICYLGFQLRFWGTICGIHCVHMFVHCLQMIGMNWCVNWACLPVRACVNSVKALTRLTETRTLFRLERLAQAEDSGLGRQVISLRRVCLA